MEVNATELRRNLFRTLDRVMGGETATITYKGVVFELTTKDKGSKLARLVPRGSLLVDPDSIIGPDEELMAQFRAKWAEDDKLL